MLKEIAKTIIVSDDIKLDNCIKSILSNRAILSRIIGGVVDECKGMTFDEIDKIIEGPIDIGTVPVEPGYDKIEGNTQEDAVLNEGKVVYDIRTFIRIPSRKTIGIKILINVEAQKDEYPGYDICERAIFYCCRMISSQLEREFSVNNKDAKKYSNIKKVYSIWICPETSQKRANTITKYSIHKDMLEGVSVDNDRYDLMTAVIINLSKKNDYEDCQNYLIKMLTVLFDEKKDAAEKINELEEKYNLPMTDGLESEVMEMCTYTNHVMEKGQAEGQAKIINNMLSKGLSIEEISNLTGTDIDFIRKVAEKLEIE